MTLQEQALTRLARSLAEAGIPYMVIGGLANAVWGEPRATLDIDVTVSLALDEVSRLIGGLEPGFKALIPDPEDFVKNTHVLPMAAESGVRVDLVFGLLPFEQEAIARAVPVTIQDTEVRFCTAEDLILLKIVSTRERDLTDVQGLLRRRIHDLDLEYLEPRIQDLAELLERPEMLESWESWKTDASG